MLDGKVEEDRMTTSLQSIQFMADRGRRIAAEYEIALSRYHDAQLEVWPIKGDAGFGGHRIKSAIASGDANKIDVDEFNKCLHFTDCRLVAYTEIEQNGITVRVYSSREYTSDHLTRALLVDADKMSSVASALLSF